MTGAPLASRRCYHATSIQALPETPRYLQGMNLPEAPQGMVLAVMAVIGFMCALCPGVLGPVAPLRAVEAQGGFHHPQCGVWS